MLLLLLLKIYSGRLRRLFCRSQPQNSMTINKTALFSRPRMTLCVWSRVQTLFFMIHTLKSALCLIIWCKTYFSTWTPNNFSRFARFARNGESKWGSSGSQSSKERCKSNFWLRDSARTSKGSSNWWTLETLSGKSWPCCSKLSWKS